MVKNFNSLCVLIATSLVAACGGGEDRVSSANLTPDTTIQDYAAYVAAAPQAWQDTIRDIDNRDIDNTKATLGRILFYDERLSSNNSVSCATCHGPARAFSDPRATVTSAGVNGNTARNSPSLANVALHPGGKMFWDERAEHLIDQADNPIVDTTEMNETFPALLVELGETDFYEPLFIAAFSDSPGNNITQARIQEAIAEFEKALLSYSSPFDLGLLSEQQQDGMNAYNQANNNCAECHGVAETGASFNMVLNAGVAAGGGIGNTPQRIDIGLTADDDGELAFKTVSLRNIVVTGPFMHNGELDDVLAFYDEGGNGGGTQPINRATTDPRVLDIRMNRNTRNDIEAFLNSLTDTTFLENPLFSDPFTN